MTAQAPVLYSCAASRATIEPSLGRSIGSTRAFGLLVAAGYSLQPVEFSPSGVDVRFEASSAPFREKTINITMRGTLLPKTPPHEDACAYVPIGPLAPGGYRINLLLQSGDTPAVAVPNISPYVGVDPTPQDELFGLPQPVIQPQIDAQPVQVAVPVITCFHTDPKYMVSRTDVEVRADVITVTVNTISPICFSAGDPEVPKPVLITLPSIPPGTYTLKYERRMEASTPGTKPLAQSDTLVFNVSSGNAPSHTAGPDVIEYHNASLDHYFMTSLPGEIRKLDAGGSPGWRRTGQSFRSAPATLGTAMVCRFYIPPQHGDSHFFSASQDECEQVRKRFRAFIEETSNAMSMALPDNDTGACPARSPIPVYRLWNRRADTNHRYTTDPATRAAMIEQGWMPEGYGETGVAMCASLR